MQAWQRVVGAWRRWAQSGDTLGVDDDGSVVRWVGLRREPKGTWRCCAVGQWSVHPAQSGLDEASEPWPVPDRRGRPVALALKGRITVRRGIKMPTGLALQDQPTWVRGHMATTMGLSVAEVAVDWGPENACDDGDAVWLVGARADRVESRAQWASARGAKLVVLEAQSLALERVLCESAQGHTEPIWLWWAGRDEGCLCTGWWHLGRWYARQDLPMDLNRLSTMPHALLAMVRAAQDHQPPIERMQWWWAGEPLAMWAERWNQQALAQGGRWLCRPAPMPFAAEIEALSQGPAHHWAMALGLALHPGWRDV